MNGTAGLQLTKGCRGADGGGSDVGRRRHRLSHLVDLTGDPPTSERTDVLARVDGGRPHARHPLMLAMRGAGDQARWTGKGARERARWGR
jgi:hypothetical protein